MNSRLLHVLPVLVALALAGCSRTEAPARGGSTAAPRSTGAATEGACVVAAGARGDAIVTPASPAELARMVREKGAPVTLVNVWATWCAPCREEMPDLLEAARRHPDVRLLLVSADFSDRVGEARTFLAERSVSGTTYIKEGADQEFIDALDSRWTGSLPATFVYDANGRAVAFWEGRADRARFEAAIQQARSAQP